MELEFQGTKAVRDTLYRIALPMSEIVGRVDFPLISRTMMLGVDDSVEDGIPHVDIRVRHIYFRSENSFAVLKGSLLHLFQKRQTLLRWTIAKGGILSWLGQSASVFSYFFR